MRNVIMNFRIWMYTSVQVQAKLLQLVTGYVARNPPVCAVFVLCTDDKIWLFTSRSDFFTHLFRIRIFFLSAVFPSGDRV